jgi:hypothetical protein
MVRHLSPEQRVRPDHPLRAFRAMADLAPWKSVEAIRRDVRQNWSVVDATRAVVAGAVAADAVLGP